MGFALCKYVNKKKSLLCVVPMFFCDVCISVIVFIQSENTIEKFVKPRSRETDVALSFKGFLGFTFLI